MNDKKKTDALTKLKGMGSTSNKIIKRDEQVVKVEFDKQLVMNPIPKYKEQMHSYKIDLMAFEAVDDEVDESVSLNISLRTNDSVTYNYLKEESVFDGTKGFVHMRASLRFKNTHNYPSNVIAKNMMDHPFYKDVLQVRKDMLNKYKNEDMLVEPYLSNLYEPKKKNEGTYEMCSTVVAWKLNEDPEVYVRIGDFIFHEKLPLYTEKLVRGSPCRIFTKKKVYTRDFNPKTRSL
jgi:hypothetical protein